MATWTDGPEYAPVERPQVFVEPEAAPLSSPTAEASPPPSLPLPDAAGAGRPDYGTVDAPALDALAPPAPPDRDPTQAFDVAATPMTSWSPGAGSGPARAEAAPPPPGAPAPAGPPIDLPPPPSAGGNPSAWGAAHAPNAPQQQSAPQQWEPQQPFPATMPPPTSHVAAPSPSWPPPAVNPTGFPPPMEPWQQAPPPQQGGFRPVTIGAIAQATTPGVLICLGVGALVSALSFPLLLVASVLAARIRYRRTQVGRAFSTAIAAAFGLGLVSTLLVAGAFDPIGWFEASAGWAQLANLALALVVPAIVGDALRRGEQPEDLR